MSGHFNETEAVQDGRIHIEKINGHSYSRRMAHRPKTVPLRLLDGNDDSAVVV
jgi:hypothetical protein